jgi:hypothetical protein
LLLKNQDLVVLFEYLDLANRPTADFVPLFKRTDDLGFQFSQFPFPFSLQSEFRLKYYLKTTAI